MQSSRLTVLAVVPSAILRQQISAFIEKVGLAALEAEDEERAKRIVNEVRRDVQVCVMEEGPGTAAGVLRSVSASIRAWPGWP